MIVPDWKLADSISAFTTTRQMDGIAVENTELESNGIYSNFNLALHVNDHAEQVLQNRQQLQAMQQLPQIQWLEQVHGTHCHRVEQVSASVVADGVWTTEPNIALAIMTADCLPVLMADRQQRVIAAIHCGWRSLAAGIIENQVQQLFQAVQVQPEDLCCWLGPCIQQAAFDVGSEVREQFVDAVSSQWREQVLACFEFSATGDNKFQADLPALASLRLQGLGVPTSQIINSQLCTFSDAQRFYSYRRDGQTGRMASVIIRRDV